MRQARHVSDRIHVLPGSHNLRALGGLPTTDGRHVRRGLVFRSDYPAFAEDVAAVRGLGLRTVVDLRGESEALIECIAWSDYDVAYHRFTVTSFERSSWEARYAGYLRDRADVVVDAVRHVIDPAHQPVLFHCAAGKDRTGVVAALVLSLLGVPDEEIVADYTLTGPSVEAVMARLSTVEAYADVVARLDPADNWPHARHMEGLLAWLAERGGAEQWLLAHGLTPAEVTAARAHLVAPAARDEDAGTIVS
jgi:protein-tyrosine phosphatase